jgi:LAS superfamily LD-carboxypeptidase LdcB
MNSWKIFTLSLGVVQVILIALVLILTTKVKALTQELELPYIPSDARITTEETIENGATTIQSESKETKELEFQNTPELFTLFTDLLTSITPAKTAILDEPVSITGNSAADDVIYTLAQDAGYIRQRVANIDLSPIEGKLLQPEAKVGWTLLSAAAEAEGIHLSIVSGYRSPEAQRSLFLKYFKDEAKKERGKEYSPKEIAAGEADKTIIRTLLYAAPPGYSRHHTGYAIDIRDVNSGYSFYEFGKTAGYKWISKNNYLNARTYGFIPSYTRGERDGGPEPEPWEFIWVGSDAIQKLSPEVLKVPNL